MAEIKLTIPDAVMPRVIDALCAYGQRPDDSPLAKGQFAKKVVVDHVMSIVRNHESRQASIAAGMAAAAVVDQDLIIT